MFYCTEQLVHKFWCKNSRNKIVEDSQIQEINFSNFMILDMQNNKQ